MVADDLGTAAQWVAPTSLIPWAKNPRINADAIEDVAASIKRFGFASPIVARKADKRVIAGHTRLAAALKLKLKKVPVRFLDISELDADALSIADNRLGEIAGWDDAKLAALLSDMKAAEFDINVLGFDEKELDKLLEEARERNEAGDDQSGADPTRRGSKSTFAPVIKYEIVFENSVQQDCWFAFLKVLKLKHAGVETVAGRLDAHIQAALAQRGE
jgi:hypothetical protein